MKMTMMVLASLVAAVSASAEVKKPGTVMESLCSRSISYVGETSGKALPAEICYASVVGEKESYITVDNDVWQVVKAGLTADIQLVGTVDSHHRLAYNLNTAMIMGKAYQESGDGLVLELPSAKVRAQNFQLVFHTQ